MSLISDIDEYGFKRSDEEIKFLSENSDEYFAKITKRQIEFSHFGSSFKNNFLLRDYTLKRFIRKGMLKR